MSDQFRHIFVKLYSFQKKMKIMFISNIRHIIWCIFLFCLDLRQCLLLSDGLETHADFINKYISKMRKQQNSFRMFVCFFLFCMQHNFKNGDSEQQILFRSDYHLKNTAVHILYKISPVVVSK